MMSRKICWLVRAHLAVLALAATFGSARAQGGITPLAADDPRATAAESVVGRLLEGDRGAVESFLRARGIPEFTGANNFAVSVTAALNAVSRPGLAIESFAQGLGDHVLVRLAAPSSPGSSVIVAVGVEPEPPHLVNAIALPNIMMGPPPGSTPVERLSAPQRQELIEALATELEHVYVSPDTGRVVGEHIRRLNAQGAFDTATDLRELAVGLTREMRAAQPDVHLAVIPPGGPPGGMGAGGAEAERRANYYMPRVEVLAGNIGYLLLTRFAGEPAALERLGHALSFLRDTDAMIIDLRSVGGGSATMSNALVSHFVAPSIPTLKVWNRATEQTTTLWTLASVAGPRRTEVPLYILVDARSGSAAEHVPFVLQELGRATIVGERTAGAGRNNTMRSLPFGFVASISTSRVQAYESGREWERVGVQPDVPTAPDAALDAALEHARAVLMRNGRRT
jgi:hypothetical protein